MDNPILLFDGFCNLCDKTVQFIIKEDKRNVFKFAPIQSEYAQRFLIKNKLQSESFKTVILIYKNKLYYRSSAILKILILLGGYWKIFAFVMILIPTSIRNFVYNYVAKKRYFWFGKKDQCIIPTPEQKDKFL